MIGDEPVEQDVLATDLVVEQIEAEGGLRLRFAVELSLKAPDTPSREQAQTLLQLQSQLRQGIFRQHRPN